MNTDTNTIEQPLSLLLIAQQAPYGRSNGHELADIALAAAAFDRQVQWLFIGDGVFQLLAAEKPQPPQKSLLDQLRSMAMFGIDQLWVDKASLHQRQLQPQQLALPVTLAQASQWRPLLQQAHHIINL